MYQGQERTEREVKRAVQEVSIYGLRDESVWIGRRERMDWETRAYGLGDESVWIEVGKTTSKKRDRKPRTNQGNPHRSWPRRVLPQLNLA